MKQQMYCSGLFCSDTDEVKVLVWSNEEKHLTLWHEHLCVHTLNTSFLMASHNPMDLGVV